MSETKELVVELHWATDYDDHNNSIHRAKSMYLDLGDHDMAEYVITPRLTEDAVIWHLQNSSSELGLDDIGHGSLDDAKRECLEAERTWAEHATNQTAESLPEPSAPEEPVVDCVMSKGDYGAAAAEMVSQSAARIAELERQLAEAKVIIETSRGSYEAAMAPPTASGPDEWWESVATNVAFYLTLAIPSLTYTAEGIQEHLARLLRRFAPAQRYPEVCEVEKAMKDARWCFSWALERENEDGDPNFEWAVRNHWSSCGRAIIATGSTPALACRAALDAKERADGA